MGTSLSGLTPATTFDGLLKVGDNDPLTSELKAISTGDGTDTILQLSDSALSVGGTLDLNFAGQTNVPMQFYGAGNQQHYIAGGNGLEIDYVTTKITENVRLAYAVSNRDVSIGESGSMGAKLGIKGSGATSATTSLLVQNSAGTELLKVQDDGAVTAGSTFYTSGFGLHMYSSKYIRSNNNLLYLANSNGDIQLKSTADYEFTNGTDTTLKLTNAGDLGIGETTPTARLHVKGSGNDNTTTSLLVQNSDGAQLFKITDNRDVYLGSSSNYIHQGIFFQGNYNAPGDWNFGTASDLGAKLGIKGSGATSATTALLVQNSAGTTAFQVDDGGNIGLGNAPLTGIKVAQTSGAARFRDLYFGNIGSSAINNSNLTSINWNGSTGIGIANSEALAATAMLHVKGSGNDATTTALLVQNSDATQLFKVSDNGATTIGAVDTGYPQITTQGQYGAVTVNAISYMAFRMNGNDAVRVTSTRDVGIGTTLPTAKLNVKGEGATSATTALLVENSAGTELLKVRDDGTLLAPQAVIADFIFNVSTLMPNNSQSLGSNTSLNRHFTNAYFKGVAHITDNVISNTTYDASAKLQVDSTTKGFLPPRMTDTEVNNISTPAEGLMVYNTTNHQMNYWNGSAWIAF